MLSFFVLKNLKEKPEISWGHYWVTGDSTQGIGFSGVGHSAFGSRLQAPAADGRNAEA